MAHYYLALSKCGDDSRRDIVVYWNGVPNGVLADLPLDTAKSVLHAMNGAYEEGRKQGHASALNELRAMLKRAAEIEAESAAVRRFEADREGAVP